MLIQLHFGLINRLFSLIHYRRNLIKVATMWTHRPTPLMPSLAKPMTQHAT